jgi:hypothetical protein
LAAIRSPLDICFYPMTKTDFEFLPDYYLATRGAAFPDSLSQYRDCHVGERCWLMGNGPSLNKMDLELFKNEIIFASNSVFLLFDRLSWRPNYYSCVDTRVLPDISSEIRQMLLTYPEITAFFPSELILSDGSSRILNTRLIISGCPNATFFQQKLMDCTDLPSSSFSLNSSLSFVSPNTVTITLMQLACFMGFASIYLIGCDTTYKVNSSVIQSGPTAFGTKGQKLLLTSTKDDDSNHFVSNYFGKGRKWHNPKTEAMIRHYSNAKHVLDDAGVRVFNATVGGNLEVFERVDYRQVLAEK